MKSVILSELHQSQKVLRDFLSDENQLNKIEKAGRLIAEAINSGNKLISCGNGGSQCDAMHFAVELTGRYQETRKPFPAIAISDASYISCVSNDFGYDEVFSRYLEALGKKGDVLLGFSTSGNSVNVIKAFEKAKELEIRTIALTGNDGGKLALLADIEIRVPYHGYADRIQEVHIKVIHIFMKIIEELTGK